MYFTCIDFLIFLSDGLPLLLQDLQPEERFRVSSASESRRREPAAVCNLWQERFQVALIDDVASSQVSPVVKQRV